MDCSFCLDLRKPIQDLRRYKPPHPTKVSSGEGATHSGVLTLLSDVKVWVKCIPTPVSTFINPGFQLIICSNPTFPGRPERPSPVPMLTATHTLTILQVAPWSHRPQHQRPKLVLRPLAGHYTQDQVVSLPGWKTDDYFPPIETVVLANALFVGYKSSMVAWLLPHSRQFTLRWVHRQSTSKDYTTSYSLLL